MTKVAAWYGVSANYLARVCEHLNVPRPARGFWAKLSIGNAPERPPLPEPRPGEVLEWAKGDGVPRTPRSRLTVEADAAEPASRRRRQGRQGRHELVAGVREFFEAGRLSDVGYLRPLKRNLVHVFVTKDALAHALDTANELFRALVRARLKPRNSGQRSMPARHRRPRTGDRACGGRLELSGRLRPRPHFFTGSPAFGDVKPAKASRPSSSRISASSITSLPGLAPA